ncbi:uncharacterized protein LOC134006147 isoform X1 [Scomber scombrus]|uniref:uncharacterized protein LOC134006147 isoform X1 n=1 Tax=Scomber scombrus TaxID=13677 RepID=UPI002DDA9053|nr:uncharacterized protein LOC134006147 isoform X1 [Scomber scombrus]
MALFALFLPLLIFSLTSASKDQREINVTPGDDVTLPCQSPNDKAITLLEWSRPELKEDGYVFFYRNDRSYESYQHTTVLGRVQLRDASMKDGDLSVILQKVNINDTGKYECRIINSNTEGRERDYTETKHVIHLNVTDPGHTDRNTLAEGEKDEGKKDEGKKDEGKKGGYDGTVVALSVTGVLLLVLGVAAFMFFRRRNVAVKQNSYQPPPKMSEPGFTH